MRRISTALTVLAAISAALLPATSAVGTDRPTVETAAAPNPNFTVHCFTTISGVQQSESWLFQPGPTTAGRTVSATHRTSYRGCSGSASSTLNQNAPVIWDSTCLDPFPGFSTETITYTWDTGDTTTVEFRQVVATREVSGNLTRTRVKSNGVVTAGSGLGKTVNRSTLFDPVGSGCNRDTAEVFGATNDFSIA
ncbi:hypothetical protein [Kitasatospora sp. CB01950]|uniref:hypothetical protein n=1 Tax=Kitasatospora sp. CB01950 TaxID=1703930 RepID=UPI000939136F|nr:hypothetical protein [Kitasatospora sp. CB01950]OKJ09287.1 hypothetical protein AMK19_18240 [Kitasatospora sp. CB01950]